MKTLKASEAVSVEDAMVVYGTACRFVSMRFRIIDEIKRFKQLRSWLHSKCEKFEDKGRCWIDVEEQYYTGYWPVVDHIYRANFDKTRGWCNSCRRTHKVSMRIKRLSHKISAIDSKLARILEVKRNGKSVWSDPDYYPVKRLQKAEDRTSCAKSPAQNTKEICHTAPNT